MPLGTFTVTINGDQIDAGTEKTAKLRVELAAGREFIKDTDAGKFLFPHLTNPKPESVSLPYTLTLPTDVTTGVSTSIGFVVTVTTEYGGRVVVGPFGARPSGSTIALVALASDFEGQVPESIATRAEVAAADAEAAAASVQREQPNGTAGLDGAGKLFASRIPDLSSTYSPRARVDELGVNVKSFGAVGDWNGTTGTDNLAAFQAAAAALPVGGGHIYIPEGDYRLSNGWLIDKENIRVTAHDTATIRTTTATSVAGCTVTFMGNGVIGTTSAQNAVVGPQRTRAEWRGGRIIATGSDTLDNALGFVRYKQAIASDVTLDADRKAITAQYGVDGIVWERIKVTRGLVASVNIEGTCKRITLRDIDITSTTGLPVDVVCNTDPNTGQPFPDNEDVLIENITIAANNNHAESVKINRSKRVTIRKSSGPGQLNLAGILTDVTLGADNSFGGGVLYGASVTTKKPASGTVTLASPWVAGSAPNTGPVVYKSADGMVTLTGSVANGSTAASTTIVTLPSGYRPATRVPFVAVNGGATPPVAYLFIESSGVVQAASTLGSAAFLSFQVTFPAA